MKPNTAWLLLFALGVSATSVSTFEIRNSPSKSGFSLPLKVNIAEPSGKQHNLKLTKADQSVLHPSVKYITIDRDHETGRRVFDSWTPSDKELQAANTVHVDHENRAVVRISQDENQNRVLDGIVNGRIVQERNGVAEFLEIDTNPQVDYVETNVNLTYNNINVDDSQDYVVEMVIVCDKEWGDKFQHDRQQILNYWTIYFWDLNMRFKTLPSSNISFRITSIIVIKSIEEQPFIEESRDEQGKAALNKVLGKFSTWIWDQKQELPKFDMAMSVLRTPISFSDGIAYLRGACNHRTGTVVWGDDGSLKSVLVGAHEIAHNLGAPHDADSDYPGGCSYPNGYIMGGGSGYTQYHFSECSDRTIGAYVRSDQAACLQRIDEPSTPVINPDFTAVLAPTMDEQCKSWFGSESEIWAGNSNCLRGLCWRGSSAYAFSPVDNSRCGEDDNGRCFRGICFPSTSNSFLVNVASGQCLVGSDRFSGTDNAQITKCPSVPTPLNQFRTFAVQRGHWLITRYSTQESGDTDKCLVGNKNEGGLASFGECSTSSGNLIEWGLEQVVNGEYLLVEATSKRCAKQEGDVVKVYANCDRNDRSMRWKISLVDEPEPTAVLPPTMAEQCMSRFGPDSVVWKGRSGCDTLWCWKGNTAYGVVPFDNSPCDEDDSGHCFRKSCFVNAFNSSQSSLVNVASRQCLLGTRRFSGADRTQIANCPSVPTPWNQFRAFQVEGSRWVITRYSVEEESGSSRHICFLGNQDEGGFAGFGDCSTNSPNLSEWNFEQVGSGEYLLVEATTKRCLKQDRYMVKVYANCDRNDRSMRWKISLNV